MQDESAQPETVQRVDGSTVNPHGFSTFLSDANPMLDLELSEALNECVQATQLHHLESTITLTLKLNQGDGYFGELLATPKVVAKPARPKTDPQPFFPTDDGGLSKYSKDQPQLPGTETT